MKTFTESNLTFSFNEKNWDILKYDEHPKYIEISNALEGTYLGKSIKANSTQ